MRSTDYRPSIEFPTGLEDRFEELRKAYLVRLSLDRGRLVLLHLRFGLPHSDAASLYDDIQRFAHGMAGAAAIFDAPYVGSAARRLEETAAAAGKSPDGRSATAVRAALGALMDLLPAGDV